MGSQASVVDVDSQHKVIRKTLKLVQITQVNRTTIKEVADVMQNPDKVSTNSVTATIQAALPKVLAITILLMRVASAKQVLG